MVLYLDSQAAIDANKDLVVRWVKIKSDSGIVGNVEADAAAGHAMCSKFSLSVGVHKHFLMAKAMVMSGNTCHFVRNVFQSICHAYWEAGLGQNVVPSNLIGHVDWSAMAKVWHPDSYMLASFTSQESSVELSDHVFTCALNAGVWREVLAEAFMSWTFLLGIVGPVSSTVLQALG
ncbi:hypothetical protein G9A89_004762 [Geosiphon pyriformis]|nr:hypothetical protein G9A89_004762 [Geosiphon pyriformis]